MFLTGVFLLFCAGCQAVKTKDLTVLETPLEQKESMKSVIGAITGKPVSDEDLKKLRKQIYKDPQAQSAIKSITNSLSGKSVIIKYCPIDGVRYSQAFKQCPKHNVDLEILK